VDGSATFEGIYTVHAAPVGTALGDAAAGAVVAAFEEGSASGRRRYADDGDGGGGAGDVDGALESFAESGMPLALQVPRPILLSLSLSRPLLRALASPPPPYVCLW
jgi:hypothetical protein